jgi:hypothetical protein
VVLIDFWAFQLVVFFQMCGVFSKKHQEVTMQSGFGLITVLGRMMVESIKGIE